MKTNLVNIILFQVGWFACVLSAAAYQPWLGVGIAMLIIAFHTWRASRPVTEITLLAICVLVGAVWDSILVWQQWLAYPSGMFLDNTAPVWIIALWALFATTLNVSLRWLKKRPVIAMIVGAIAGPLAYIGGVKLGAVNMVDLGSVDESHSLHGSSVRSDDPD